MIALCPREDTKNLHTWLFPLEDRHVRTEIDMLLGVWNKIMNKNWNFAHTKIEVLPIELLE